jgi:hypothetical protein
MRFERGDASFKSIETVVNAVETPSHVVTQAFHRVLDAVDPCAKTIANAVNLSGQPCLETG